MSAISVVGLGGQAEAGDDTVGWVVVDRLAPRLRDVELVRTSDPTVLVERIQTAALLIVIDALLMSPPGQVLTLQPEDLATARTISSHSLPVSRAITLGRSLAAPCAKVQLVAVTIDPPRGPSRELSAKVAAALDQAAARVFGLVRAFREKEDG